MSRTACGKVFYEASRALSAEEIKRLYNLTQSKFNASTVGKLTNGLVGHWTFDGPDMADVTAYDRSGQGNNGTLTNGPVRATGRIGQALDFDGSDDYVNAGSGTSLDNITVKTVSFWVKCAITTNSQSLMNKGPTGVGGSGWGMEFRNSAGSNGPNKVRYQHQWSGAAGGNAIWFGSTNITDTTVWYHIVLIYDSGSSSKDPVIYVNGIADTITEATAPSGTEGNDAANSLYIGIAGNGTSQPHDSLIDDVRVYNRALTANEIKRLYNMGR